MNINEYEAKFERVYCKRTPGMSPCIEEGMIQFDEETASWLAGPFDGNYAYFMIQDCRTMPHWNVKTEAEERQRIRFSHYAIPNYRLKGFNAPAESEEHLQKRLAMLTAKEVKEWRRYVDEYPHDYATTEKPIRFYICGNDDASYTKFFPTVEAAQEELKLFLSMEPINYHLHLAENGFVFTN